jgi:hypothetical protein
MSDIVERLRRLQNAWKDDVGEAYGKAADEIERLRKLLAATERDLERALAALDHHLKADMARRRDEP